MCRVERAAKSPHPGRFLCPCDWRDENLTEVAPGITIRDRLRVLQPNDPDSYYQSRELVPDDMLGHIGRAKIVFRKPEE